MIRFVVECHEMQYGTGIDHRDYVTVDVELPELEALLKRGGCGEGGFESWRLLGAEILPANAEVSGAGTASAGLPGITQHTQRRRTMTTTNHQALSLLQQAFDALEAQADSDIDTFEDDEEEAEAVPAQYACRKIMEVIDVLRAENRTKPNNPHTGAV